jgi:hypothetical protein
MPPPFQQKAGDILATGTIRFILGEPRASINHILQEIGKEYELNFGVFPQHANHVAALD